MVISMKIHLDRAISEVVRFGCCVLLVCTVGGQTVEPPSGKRIYEADQANVADAIAKVKSGNFVRADVDMIGRGKAVQAIPILKQQFVRVQDPLDKATIARVLIKLGDKDDVYWDYLVKLAAPALDSDAPDFMNFDPQAPTAAGPSPEFVAWAKAHNVPPNGPNGTAAEDAMYMFPARVLVLGLTGDPKAIPLLRQALSSPNHMIEVAAAQGLAELQDKDSVPLIIGACYCTPAGRSYAAWITWGTYLAVIV